MTRTFRRLTRTFRRLLAFTLLLTVLTASPARAQLHNAGDPCPEPTAGRIFTQEGSAGPSLVCNGTTLEVDESISTGPYARGIGTAAPKATLDVNGGVRIGADTTCAVAKEGTIRYVAASDAYEFCNGTAWTSLGGGKWLDGTNAGDIYYSAGPVGVGTSAPKAPLHVAGEAIIGSTTGLACDANREGALRWKTTAPKCIEICDGSSWACVGCANTLATFFFTNQTDLNVSTLVTSNIAPIGGINAGCTESVSVSGTGGSPEYRICSTSDCSSVVQTWTTATNTLDMQGKYLQLRATSSASYATTFTITANVGPTSSNWSITTASGCSNFPVGTVCADGTVYAGTSPASSTPMFITRCDAGRTWDGSACTGTRVSLPWNNGNTSGYVDTSLANCTTAAACTADGRADTTTLVGTDSDSGVAGVQPHQAAAYCDSLDIHGHTDWYLPSLPETVVILRANNPDLTNGTADDNTLGDFAVATYYWASSEYNSTNAWSAFTTAGNQAFGNKGSSGSSGPVRCARR